MESVGYDEASPQPGKRSDGPASVPRQPSSTDEPYLSAEAQQQLFAYALVLPVMLLLVGLVGYPLFYAVWCSFTNLVVGGTGEWTGCANFRYLAQSPVCANTIRNTLVLVAVSDIFKLAIGLG